MAVDLTIQQLGNRFYDYRKDCWGNSYSWAFIRPLSQVKYLVIHHSVTDPFIKNSDGTVKRQKTGKEQVDEIGSLHKARGWTGYGYHFVIDTFGVVWYVGDLQTGRANVLNHNEAVIGINLIGDFTKHLPTDIQINSAHDLCSFFLFNYPALINVNDWENNVIGHKDAIEIWSDTTVTACPGTSWPVDMKSRIKDNVVYSGQEATTSESPQTPPSEETIAPEATPETTVSEIPTGGEEVQPDIPVDTAGRSDSNGVSSDPAIVLRDSPTDISKPVLSLTSLDVFIQKTLKKVWNVFVKWFSDLIGKKRA